MPEQSIGLGSDNIQALIKDSTNAHIEINQRLTAQLLVPAFRRLTPSSRRTDLDLLLPRSAITSFVGREEVWQDSLAWCMSGGTISARCVIGRSGSGKTRLALELVHHLRSLDGWDARFVAFVQPEPFDLWAKTAGTNNVLLVVDNAGDVSVPLGASVRRLANEPPQGATRKLRILLLARHADWDEGWLSALQPRSAIEESVRDLFQPDHPIVLPPLKEEDRLRIYRQALSAAATFTESVAPPAAQPGLSAPHSHDSLADPLSLIMAALTAVHNVIPDPLALTPLGLAHEVAGTLAKGAEAAFPDNPQLAMHMAAYVTLSGGLSRDEAQDALAAEAKSNNLGEITNPGGFIDRLRTWLPGEDSEIGAITPDIIGEAFLLGNKTPRLRKPQSTLLRALALRRDPVLRTLIRLTQDFCLAEEHARKEPLVWLQHVIEKGFADDFALLRDIEAALPDSTVVLRTHAVVVTGLIVERLREMFAGHPKAELTTELLAQGAAMLNNLSNRLSSLGVRERALTSADGAVAMYRELADGNRTVFLSELAAALNTQSNARSGMGMLDEALGSAEESVKLGRDLVTGNHRMAVRNLALFLTTLANRRAELGLTDDALTSATEAVSLCREGVQRHRDVFLADLAHALIIVATVQSLKELRQEAYASASEAVLLRRELIQRNRDAFLADLAHALVALSATQGDLGRHAEAIATADEAIALYRGLVTYSPRSFLRELAHALEVLSVRQGDAGHRHEALATAQEANRVYRQLVQAGDQGFRAELASSLINLGKAQLELGHSREALSAAREAFVLSDGLVQQARRPHLPQLALAATNLVAAQAAEGLWADAVTTQETAVTYYRELAEHSRSAHLPGLASALVNQAGVFSMVEMRPQALAPAREAVEIYRELVAANEDAFSWQLATALVNHGRALGEVGQIPEAIQVFQEAILLAQQMALANAGRFLPVLALALNNLAAMQNALGLKEETFQSATYAVAHYRTLIEMYGDVYALESARSRHTLGVALVGLDRVGDGFEMFGSALADVVRLGQMSLHAKQILQLLLGGYMSAGLQAHLVPDIQLVTAAVQLMKRESTPPGESP